MSAEVRLDQVKATLQNIESNFIQDLKQEKGKLGSKSVSKALGQLADLLKGIFVKHKPPEKPTSDFIYKMLGSQLKILSQELEKADKVKDSDPSAVKKDLEFREKIDTQTSKILEIMHKTGIKTRRPGAERSDTLKQLENDLSKFLQDNGKVMKEEKAKIEEYKQKLGAADAGGKDRAQNRDNLAQPIAAPPAAEPARRTEVKKPAAEPARHTSGRKDRVKERDAILSQLRTPSPATEPARRTEVQQPATEPARHTEERREDSRTAVKEQQRPEKETIRLGAKPYEQELREREEAETKPKDVRKEPQRTPDFASREEFPAKGSPTAVKGGAPGKRTFAETAARPVAVSQPAKKSKAGEIAKKWAPTVASLQRGVESSRKEVEEAVKKASAPAEQSTEGPRADKREKRDEWTTVDYGKKGGKKAEAEEAPTQAEEPVEAKKETKNQRKKREAREKAAAAEAKPKETSGGSVTEAKGKEPATAAAKSPVEEKKSPVELRKRLALSTGLVIDAAYKDASLGLERSLGRVYGASSDDNVALRDLRKSLNKKSSKELLVQTKAARTLLVKGLMQKFDKFDKGNPKLSETVYKMLEKDHREIFNLYTRMEADIAALEAQVNKRDAAQVKQRDNAVKESVDLAGKIAQKIPGNKDQIEKWFKREKMEEWKENEELGTYMPRVIDNLDRAVRSEYGDKVPEDVAQDLKKLHDNFEVLREAA